MELLKKYSTYEILDTTLTADCVETIATDKMKNIFAIGTYQLNKETRERNGMITIRKYNDESKTSDMLCTAKMPGILDMKWNFVEEKYLISCACTDAELKLYNYNTDTYELNLTQTMKIDENEEVISLSVDWDKQCKSHLLASHSDGYISIHNINGEEISKWKGHNLYGMPTEVWIANYNKTNSNIIYSGADDTYMKIWDDRSLTEPIQIIKEHGAGVCSMQSHPYLENIFTTGSYDEYVRIWDSRKMNNSLTKIKLDGGIWRIKWHPYQTNLLLIAGMRGGGYILNYENNKFEILKQNLDHESENLTYGSDWINPQKESKSYVVGTASFYNHEYRTWGFDL